MPKRSVKRRVALILAGGLALTLLASIVAFVAWRVRVDRAIDAELARIPADKPTTLAELEAYYPYPTGDNAADVFAEAEALLPASDRYWPRKPEWEHLDSNDWPPGHAPPARELARWAWRVAGDLPAALHMDAAAGMDARFPVAFDTLFPETPHIAGLRRLADARRAWAALLARHGHAADALAQAHAVLDLADLLRHEPILLSQLVRILLRAHAVAIVADALPFCTDPALDADLAALQGRLLRAADDPTIRRGAVGERALAYGILTDERLAKTEPSLGGDVGALHKATGLLALNRLHVLRGYRHTLDAMRDPFDATAVRAPVPEPPRAAMLADVLRLAPEAPMHTEGDIQALLRCAAAGVAAWRFRLTHGNLPSDWADLVPTYLDAPPMDPYTDPLRPLGLTDRDGFRVIYSLGHDRRDDRGDYPDDMRFRLRR